MTRADISTVEAVPGRPHMSFATFGEHHVVVKTGDPGALAREAAALQLLSPLTPRVWDLDPMGRTLVTERILPGDDIRPLARRDDDAATTQLAEVFCCMRRIPLTGGDVDQVRGELPDLAGVLEPLENCSDTRLPRALRDAAMSLGRDLVSGPTAVVLHGDLHHSNLIRSRSIGSEPERWIPIDPHGWIGDPVFDTVPMLVAPESLMLVDATLNDHVDTRDVEPSIVTRATLRRAQIIAEITGDDPERILTWAFVGAVIAEARMLIHHRLVHGAPLALAIGLHEQLRITPG